MDKKIIFLIIVLATLGYCIYRTRKRKLVSNVFTSLFAILFLLLAIEFCYRNFLRAKQTISTINSSFQFDSLMGYKFKDTGRLNAIEYFGGGDTIYNTFYTILPDTNFSGPAYPFRKGYKGSTAANAETVFLGCSVTFGECLSDEQTLPYQYGLLNGTPTVNRGCNGFGIHQVYKLFKYKYANQDNHNRVFVYSFLEDHLLRANGMYDWNMAGPYYVIQGDSLVDRGPSFLVKDVKGLKLAKYTSFFGAFTFIKDNIEKIAYEKAVKELTDNDLAAPYMMLRQMAQIIQKTGGKFVILNWDNGYDKKNPEIVSQRKVNENIVKEVQNTGALILPVSKAIDFNNKDFFVPNDGHPSALADKTIANYLYQNISH
ncbi:MAG: hypothetical protein ABUT20_60655 [Bacteroidota bacterium]